MNDLGCAEKHVLSCHLVEEDGEDVYLFISVPMENIHFDSALWSLSFFISLRHDTCAGIQVIKLFHT